MKVGILSQIQSKTKVLSVVGLASLVIVSAGIQNNSIKTQELSTLKGGLQTCFTRLHNSYTARLLGSDSQYLSSGFTETTEECLGETIHTYESLGMDNSIILDDLNTLANDTNWFHQKIMQKESQGLFDGNPEKVLLSALSSRFEKLEIKKIQINDAIHSLHNALGSRKSMMSIFFYVIAGLVPLFLGLDYLRRRSDESELEEVLEESRRLSSDEESVSLKMIQPLIVRALAVVGLKKLAELFEMAYIENQSALGEDSTLGVQVPIKKDRGARDEQIEQIWTRSEEEGDEGAVQSAESREINKGETEGKSEGRELAEAENIYPKEEIELEGRIASVIEIISSKVFTQGINLDINSEEVKIFGEEEALDQSLYHLLTNAINNYNFDDPKKYLSVNVRVLGSTVLLDVFDSGRKFSKEFLKQVEGIASGVIEHTDLAIAERLIVDMGANISFENVGNEDGDHVGRKVQLTFTAVNPKKKKVTQIQKGTKKEILERMNH